MPKEDGGLKIAVSNSLIFVNNVSKKRVIKLIEKEPHNESANFGLQKIVGFIDVELGVLDNEKMIDIIHEGMDRYYKNSLDYKTAFDDFINFINRKIDQLIEARDVKDLTNIAICLVKENDVLFSATGKIFIYFLHNNSVQKLFPDENSPINVTNKLFSYSLSGVILQKSCLYMCNADFDKKVNAYHLEKSCSEFGIKTIISSLEEAVLTTECEGGFVSEFIYLPNKARSSVKTGELDMSEMLMREREVQESISPSIFKKLQNFIKKNSLPALVIRYLVIGLKQITKLLKRVGTLLIFFVVNLFFIITNARGKRQEKRAVITSKFTIIYSKIRDAYNSLTVISKILFVILIICAFGFTAVVVFSVRYSKIKELKALNVEKIEIVKNLDNEADSQLLFREKGAAISKLKEALSIMNTIPAKIHDKEYASLYDAIKMKLYKIQSISEITSPTIIADFSAPESIKIYSPFIIDNSKLIVFSDNKMVKIDLSTSVSDTYPYSLQYDKNKAYYYNAEKSELYTSNNATSVQITNTKTLTSELRELIPQSRENPKLYNFFNDRLYILSDEGQQFSVWKHSKSLTGFGKPNLVINDNYPKDAEVNSMAIDGNIYILFSNNEIKKYYKGHVAEWKYNKDDIPGEIKLKKLISGENISYIYILGGNSVTILSKEGEMLSHIILTFTKNVEDFVIDELTKTIYLLSDQKIYGFTYSM